MSYIPPTNRSAQLLEDLKDLPIPTDIKNSTVLLVGKMTIGDSLGGLYYWNPTATGEEDTKFLSIIPSNKSATGRWVRFNQTAKQMTQGYYVNTNGMKYLYLPLVTDANGQVTANLTTDGTPTGPALFTEIWQAQPFKNPNATNSVAPIIGDPQVSANLKTLTCTFSRGGSTTLGGTLLSILGLVIPGLVTVGSGISVIVKVEGI